MKANTLTVRGATIAFLFPVQPELGREVNVRFYDLVTGNGVELAEFSQTASEVLLSRKRGPASRLNQLQVRVDHLGTNLRLLVSEDFPTRAFEMLCSDADSVWEAFAAVWPLERLGGQPVLTEVSLRVTAGVDGDDATRYLLARTMKLEEDALQHLGRGVQGVGLTLMLPLQISTDDSLPLRGASATLKIETLLEDPTRLYFEFTATWPYVLLPPQVVAQGMPHQLNAGMRKPSEYLDDAYEFLAGKVVEFLLAASR